MKNKWTLIGSLLAVVLLALAVGPGQAQGPDPQGDVGIQAAVGTAFTYQGQLKKGGSPVNGACDLQFSLWDTASGGTQVGTTQTKTNVSVSNGLFTTSLDFGSAFTGDARWLAIAVRCPAGSGSYTNLSPRQALTAAPYALGLRPGAYVNGDISDAILGVRNTAASAIFATGMYGQSDSTSGLGVYGYASAASGAAYGVKGVSNSPAGTGVYGLSNTSGNGVAGQSSSGNGMFGKSSTGDGVRGESSGANKSGVYGESKSTAGYGVAGWATATSGYAFGVYGQSESTNGRGVDGHANATSGEAIGVYGQSSSPDGFGVYGWAVATSGYPIGVYGRSTSPGGTGVYGYAPATSGQAWGVWGRSNSSTDGRGVYGYASATSGTNYGVYGESDSPTGYAGYFSGNAHVTGNFSAGGSKSFKIDHPLDPAGRYLYHFAQEGPEVQNVYNGVVTLDASGEAVVALPAYFSALNAAPYRYQLTAIGAPMPNLYIAEEIQGNTFTIAGGVPGKKVSWEVTAVRHDPYLRDHPAQAEVDKPAEEQGTYLYPEGYGRPREMGLDYQRNADLFERTPEPSSTGGGE